ncbi:MAG: (Fe-S)-binding protein [Desulfuromonadales bacterium]|nr:(Fe-S)-binding protein [Desulfuromonadales bacterium]
MSKQFISKKSIYDAPLGDDKAVVPELRRDCYAVFACRHKFCRDVCPVFIEERDESGSSYGFHAAILGMAEGNGVLSEMADTSQLCLECGACQLRCPNTLYTGDFYGQTTTTIDLVRKIRRDLIAQGTPPTNWDDVARYIAEDLDREKNAGDAICRWAEDLNLPTSGETMLFVDYFNAFQTTDVPRNAAKILKHAGVGFGTLGKPFPTLGELYESDQELWLAFGKKNVESLQAAGAKTVIITNPHDYVFFANEYPKYFEIPFEVVYITDYIWSLYEQGKIQFENEVNLKATYHDPCTLNKQTLSWEAPRNLIAAISGISFQADDHVTQWDYCCGNGLNSFKRLLPDVSYKVGLKRLSLAEEVEAEKLIVACPHCLDQFTEVQTKSGSSIEPVHILDLVMQAAGID